MSSVALDWRPMRDWVVVRRSEQSDRSRGGIIIPDSAKQKSADGTVLAVGPGFEMPSGFRIPTGVKPGDRVVFGAHAGDDRDVGGECLLFIVASQIEGIIES